jgi:hypothetical protein
VKCIIGIILFPFLYKQKRIVIEDLKKLLFLIMPIIISCIYLYSSINSFVDGRYIRKNGFYEIFVSINEIIYSFGFPLWVACCLYGVNIDKKIKKLWYAITVLIMNF